MSRSLQVENAPEGREAPRVLVHEGDPQKPLIAVALKDPGGTNFLLPVIILLKEKQYPIVLHSTGKTAETLEQLEGFAAVAAHALESVTPQIVVRTYADLKHGASRALPEELEERWRSATFIDVEDYPAGPKRTIQREGGRAPDYLLVINDAAKESRVRNRRPGIDPEPDHVIVTGSPVFDQYAGADHRKRKREAREKFAVGEGEFVVLFSGQNPPATPIALQQTVDALNALKTKKNKNMVLLFSRHPRDKETDYTPILNAFTNGRVIVQKTAGLSTEEAGYAADLLVSTHSTEALKSMHRGIATLHIALHRDIRDTKDYREFDQPPFPVAARASFWISDGDDTEAAKRVFGKAIDNDAVRAAVAVKARKAAKINKEDPDGKSAERAAAAIMQAAAQRRSAR